MTILNGQQLFKSGRLGPFARQTFTTLSTLIYCSLR